ncbi:MAG: purine-nucleoside phosphorylase [Firmicutes bacterium]|nr:purine-nucleoside phosphorylase [Bacillota bacterium]
MMNKEYEKLKKAYECIREKTDFVPEVALILGSGLGALADEIEAEAIVDYKEIEGFPQSTVPGHKGRFVFGRIGDVKTVIMQGRVHYYEGYAMSDVVLPTRLMGMMGAKVLFLTNAAGGCNPDYDAGDFMLIRDQIMAFVPNPLIGPNMEELGTRFPDMSDLYSESLRELIKKTAGRLGTGLKEGVYVQFTGPSFETPAEIRMASMLGGDAVGMSTAVEAVAGHHMGMQVCGISCISNKAAGLSETPLTHEEVQETADRVAPYFRELVKESIREIGKTL